MQTENHSIAVLGAGSWGMALALLLAKNNLKVHVWDRDQSLLEEMSKEGRHRYLPNVNLSPHMMLCHTLEEALKNVQDVLLVVPSHAFAEALQNIKPFINAKTRIVWATKGLELGTGQFLHQVAERELGQAHAYAVLSGPSFAREVALGLPTAVAIASKNLIFAKDLSQYFSSDNFSVDITDDLIGVQLGGVLKNVLAVAVGISDGVKFGANARAALITKGLAEMVCLGKVLGARSETLMGLAGCGDVILTCTDDQSRNRRFGLALAEGLTQEQALQRIGQVVEAVYNVEQLCGLAKRYQVDLPIAEQVLAIMKYGASPREAINALFKRVPVN